MKPAFKFLSLLAIAGVTLIAPQATSADNTIPGTAAVIALGTVDVVTYDGTPIVGPSFLNVAFFGPEGYGNRGWFGSASLTNNGASLFNTGPWAPGFAGVAQFFPGFTHGSVTGTIIHKGQVAHLYITFFIYNGTTTCHINLLNPAASGTPILSAGPTVSGLVLLDE